MKTTPYHIKKALVKHKDAEERWREIIVLRSNAEVCSCGAAVCHEWT